jgi:hypothetical protein
MKKLIDYNNGSVIWRGEFDSIDPNHKDYVSVYNATVIKDKQWRVLYGEGKMLTGFWSLPTKYSAIISPLG